MNLPNKITICRICMIPLVIFFYLADFIPYGKLVALIVFAIACLTDFLDGHIARSRGLVTNLGKFLDPIADKCLVMTGILLLIAAPVTANGGAGESLAIIYPYYVGIIAGIIILARELMVSAFRQIAATRNIVLAADIYGKIKAVFQFITILFYFLYAFLVEEFYYAIEGTANTVLSLVGYVLLAITVALTIVSGVKYVTDNIQVLKDEKK